MWETLLDEEHSSSLRDTDGKLTKLVDRFMPALNFIPAFDKHFPPSPSITLLGFESIYCRAPKVMCFSSSSVNFLTGPTLFEIN